MSEVDRKNQLVLEKAFEILEISKRRDVLLKEFSELLGGSVRVAKSVPPIAKRASKTAPAKKKAVPPAGKMKILRTERILAFMRKHANRVYTVSEVAKGIDELHKRASVNSTLHHMVSIGSVYHLGENAYSLKGRK